MNKNYNGFPFQNLNLSYFSQLQREVVIHPIVILRHRTNKNIEPLHVIVKCTNNIELRETFFQFLNFFFLPIYMLFFLKMVSEIKNQSTMSLRELRIKWAVRFKNNKKVLDNPQIVLECERLFQQL